MRYWVIKMYTCVHWKIKYCDPLVVFRNLGNEIWNCRGKLTHWCGVTHICISKLTTIGRCQAIIWTQAGILFIRTVETNFSEMLDEIRPFSFKECTWKCRLRNGVHFVSASMCQNISLSILNTAIRQATCQEKLKEISLHVHNQHHECRGGGY